MRASALALVLVGLVTGCNQLPEEKCRQLRTEAFDLLTGKAHPCADDSECMPSRWPGCAQPVSTKNEAKINEIKKKFDDGSCMEHEAIREQEERECREPPFVYCKQGLCVFREERDQENPTP